MLWISVVALIVMGASDVISVYIRSTLVQLWTPDQLRGRVSAVNAVFLNASNEVGAFRAGGSAALVGAIPAVVLGGIGTIVITALWYQWFPELRARPSSRRADVRAQPNLGMNTQELSMAESKAERRAGSRTSSPI